jgi:hypothetical protein
MPAKNKLSDLNDHLFEQLERLNDDDLNGDELAREIDRASAMNSVAKQIVDNGRLQLSALKLQAEHFRPGAKLPPMLDSGVVEDD